jgi:hypothetical protein
MSIGLRCSLEGAEIAFCELETEDGYSRHKSRKELWTLSEAFSRRQKKGLFLARQFNYAHDTTALDNGGEEVASLTEGSNKRGKKKKKICVKIKGRLHLASQERPRTIEVIFPNPWSTFPAKHMR